MAAALACGGGPAPGGGVRSPDTAKPSTSANPDPGASSGATTTTAALPDAGDSEGTKLRETAPAAATTASAAAAPKAPHGHDFGRGPTDIGAIVKAHREEARACYEKQLADHPGIEGDLVITWTIDPKGNVTQTAVDTSRSQITEPGVVACVSGIIKKIQFAPSPGGFETSANYPFNFHPHRGKPAP
jgi:hypothetical protein